jgi:sulfur dioxygenase
MLLRQLFEPVTSTYTYLLACEQSRQAVLIDPVRETIERDLQLLRELNLTLLFVLDTHVHADHVTSAAMLRSRVGARSVVAEVSGTACADVKSNHGDKIRCGSLTLEVRATPGHTNGCSTFVVQVTDQTYAFTGDALLIRGCGRTDFQGGDARALYRSVREQILSLPPTTIIYPGHDYKGHHMSTVAEERAHNPRLNDARTEDEFVHIMQSLRLPPPKNLAEAVPANQACGDVHANALPTMMRTSDGVPEVGVDWVLRTHTDDRYRLIDVREAEELLPPPTGLGAIDGVEHIPLAQLEGAVQSWERTTPLVIVCRSGKRSARAATSLEQLGFIHVASMRGGMLEVNAKQRGDV